MVKMINFIEEDDNDAKLSDLPFMKKKLAEKDALIQEKDALIQQLLVQIK